MLAAWHITCCQRVSRIKHHLQQFHFNVLPRLPLLQNMHGMCMLQQSAEQSLKRLLGVLLV